jgi:hypothetical protein
MAVAASWALARALEVAVHAAPVRYLAIEHAEGIVELGEITALR